MNSVLSYSNLLKNSILFHFLLIEDYEEGALQKDLVTASFVERFQAATLRKSYR